MVKIVVTGGTGFVGSHVADHFAQDNEVIVLDNLSRAKTLRKIVGDQSHNLAYLTSRHRGLEFRRIDVTDFKALQVATASADVIIHTAGQVAVTTSMVDPRVDFENNALGTFNVLEAARLSDSAIVFCSTNKVYGEGMNSIPVKEELTRYAFDSPTYLNGIPEDFPVDLTGHTPYGSSKLAADIYVQDYAHTYGLRTGVFRMSCIYGERQLGVEDQGWISWFIIAILTGQRITIYGDGKQVRDTLYVGDLVDAFERFLRSDIKHAVFNIGGGTRNTLSLLELLALLRKLSGREPEFSFSDWRSADQRVYISDISKIQEMLGWKPSIGPEEGVERVVNWVRENQHLFKKHEIRSSGSYPSTIPRS